MNSLRRSFRWAGRAGAALVFGSAPAFADPTPASGIDWAGDLAVFRRELPARHVSLFFRTDRATFENALTALERELPQLADPEVALRLQEIVATMGDDHSSVVLSRLPGAPEPRPVPLGLQWFSDGWRVTATDRTQESLLGRKVIALGGVPLAEVEARVARLLSPGNPWLVKSRLPQAIIQPAVLRHLGLASTALTVTTQDGDAAPVDSVLVLDQAGRGTGRAQFRPKSQAETFSNQRAILWHKVMPAERIFFLQYNRCEGREVAERKGDAAAAARLPSLAELFEMALKELRAAVEQGQVSTIVVDLRFNPGGASDFGTRFAGQVADLAALTKPGRAYVIVGRRTFSSAIINALDFKRVLGARFVGEPTSGTANHYGEVQSFALPSSGATVYYSTKYLGDPGGDFAPLRPDIAAELSFADFTAGVDPALEAIKAAARETDRQTPPP